MRRGVADRVGRGITRDLRGGIAIAVRAFVAIPVLPPALAPMQTMVAGLRQTVPAVRWAPTETMHITLHFFGDITEHDASRATAALADVVAAQAPLHLALSRLHAFEERGATRVLWCGVAGDVDGLAELASRCRRAARGAGFAVERRPFRAHCTLGRPRRNWPDEAHAAWRAARAAPVATPSFSADRAVMYESLLAPGGSRHVARATLRFGAPEGRGPAA